MYDINSANCSEIKSAELGVLSSQELKRISLGKYENQLQEFEKVSKDGTSNRITYDPRFGTIDYTQICSVCFEKHDSCLGHIGHIEFVLPVFNPLFYKDLQELLNLVCYNCYALCYSEDVIFLLKHIYQLKSLNEIESSNKFIIKKNNENEYIVSEIERLYNKICKESNITMEDIVESICQDYENSFGNNEKDNNENDSFEDRQTYELWKKINDDIYNDDQTNEADFSKESDNKKKHNYSKDKKTNQEIENKETKEKIKFLKEKIKKYKFDISKLAFQSNYNYEEYVILNKAIKLHMKKGANCSNCKFRRSIVAKTSPKKDTINFVGIYTNNSFFKKYISKKSKNEGFEENGNNSNDDNDDDAEVGKANKRGKEIKSEKIKNLNNSENGIDKFQYEGSNNKDGDEEDESFKDAVASYKRKTSREKCTVRLFSFQIIDLLKKIFVENNKEIINLVYPFTKKDGYQVFFLYYMGISSNRFRTQSRGIHKRTRITNYICKLNNYVKLCINSKKNVDFDHMIEYNKNELDLYNEMFLLFSLRLRQRVISNSMEFNIEIAKSDFLRCYSLIYNNKIAYLNILFGNLQLSVNTFLDSSLIDKRLQKNMDNISIREILDKKEGILRKNIMGKRVNNCARTVISPDTFIETNQIGVPIEFAKTLTIDEHITENNFEYVKKLIENGPDVYPGALSYKDGQGRVFKLSHSYENRMNLISRLTHILQKGKHETLVLHRHARDGDIVIMNRQPTLHKFSIMAHFLKIFEKEKVFRLNYVNCSSYNADFDGDEMNLHLLQTPLARAEATHLMNSDFLFTSFKDGSPLRGLAQDFILGGLHLTSLETFLNYDEYCNLLQCSLNGLLRQKNAFFFSKTKHRNTSNSSNTKDGNKNSGGNDKSGSNSFRGINAKISNYSYIDPYATNLNKTNFTIKTEEPTILFPKKLWTGKQLISSILKTIINELAIETYNKNGDNSFMENFKGINYVAKAKTDPELWSFDPKKECEIIIKNSELLQGVLDKLHFGASSNSFVHLCYELFGPKSAAVMLDCFGRLFISFLQLRGTSLSLYDFILKKKAKVEKKKIKKRISFTGFYLQNLFVYTIGKALNADMNKMDEYSNKKISNYEEGQNLFSNKLYDIYLNKSQIINKYERKLEKKMNIEDKHMNTNICLTKKNIPNKFNLFNDKELNLKKDLYFITFLNKEIEEIFTQNNMLSGNVKNEESEETQKCKYSDSPHLNYIIKKENYEIFEKCLVGKNKLNSLEKQGKDGTICEGGTIWEDESRYYEFVNSIINKLYNSINNPIFYKTSTFTSTQVVKVIEKIVNFLKEAKCNKKLKVFILFELFQNENIVKYFPSLIDFASGLNTNISSEEIVETVINNILLKKDLKLETEYVSSLNTEKIKFNDNKLEKTNDVILKKYLHLYSRLIKIEREKKGKINNNSPSKLKHDEDEINETKFENSQNIGIDNVDIIKNCLISSLPSFALNEDITNLSYNNRYQYYEKYLNIKDEKYSHFKFYRMKDVFHKLDFLINNFFSLKRINFDGLLDSLFQPYLCRVSSGTNNLITMENLMNKFLTNGFSNMIFTGAKGSKVNYSMICGMLDQQYLEGKRVPRMRSGKTLPSFHRYDYGARSCGLITDCFLEGLRPQEYFFHCMSGREGLIDTAVKTAKSGYIQRCLIKSMESVILHYDGTVRNEDNSIIQFLYGEDGIDPSKTAYLNLPSDLINNYNISFSKYLNYGSDQLILSNQRLFAKNDGKKKNEDGKKNEKNGENGKNGKNDDDDGDGDGGEDDPLIFQYNPYTYIGSISDNYNAKLNNILINKKFNITNYNENFDSLSASLLRSKYFHSLCSPGESIGILVAQSFGEPATQMTLNTFHLAGTENVTMGIPRLKEIFLTSKLTSKPMIYVPIKLDEKNNNNPNQIKNYITNIADKILSSYQSILLSEVIYGIGINRKLIIRDKIENKEIHTIKLDNNLLSKNNKENESNWDKSDICKTANYSKILQVIENTNLNFDLKKEWVHEIVIQFDNLNHFCKVNKHLSIPFILYKMVNIVLMSILNKIQNSISHHNIKNIHFINHEHYDELFDFISEKMSEEFNFAYEKYEYKDDEDEINAKLKYMPNKSEGNKLGDDDDHYNTSLKTPKKFSEDNDDNFSMDGKNEGSDNDKNDKSDGNNDSDQNDGRESDEYKSEQEDKEYDESEEDAENDTDSMLSQNAADTDDDIKHENVNSSESDDGDEKKKEKKSEKKEKKKSKLLNETDSESNYSSDESITDSSIINEDPKESNKSKKEDKLNTSSKKRKLTDVNDNIKNEQNKNKSKEINSDSSISSESETELKQKMSKKFSEYLYDYKNRMNKHNLDVSDYEDPSIGISGSKNKLNDQKYIKNLIDKIKSSLLCFIKKIDFSPITWVLKFELSWDVNFFPYPIDFLSYLQNEISKEILFKVKDLNNPKILKGKDITHSGEEYELQIEGRNVYKLFNIKDKYIDKTKLYCNDIYTIVKTYGIEAGRLCITKELKKVFEAYGIKIDFRHLSFISDFMTHTGDLKSFNRYGMAACRNVFHKMSFECATTFMIQGCIQNSVDYLSTPSSSLFFGKHIKVGTNVSNIVTSIKAGK
ncbi:RNA polymerase I, putative [Plasmodium yoelii]|uniref:DNA-directed RNA polymerase subunit n=2 Tax=Plasmodium yoelii TaxID=5861 RepID=Q7RJK4_PLAYO|nr:RNA polymerase I, putative [Plasmodium yoelii]EAA22812.1 RNA polymerase A/beta'/A'' subunit, putative [Plasmodium yoelii yoelii]CDU18795.1 RNA polymerase I, putative [Plasmodium yoelii]VTZ79380.1 RNA polymerase I, putative [Plasmodium yoelii]|eukprot:XP_731247.1 RNA polymerase I, putative [Plasmodium yoelii]